MVYRKNTTMKNLKMLILVNQLIFFIPRFLFVIFNIYLCIRFQQREQLSVPAI